MDMYSKNLTALKQRGLEIADFFSNLAENRQTEVVTSAPSGFATFYYTNDTNQKFLVHSLYNPVKEAFSLIEAKKLDDVGAVFIFGLGFGYHLKALLKHSSFSGSIYVIEPSFEIFKTALTYSDLTEAIGNPRVHFFIEPDSQKMKDIVDTHPLFRSDISKPEFIYMPVYRQMFKQYFEQVMDAVNIRLTMNMATVMVTAELARNWDFNTAENLPLALATPALTCFKDSLHDKPIILVAAGPSLNKTIEYLKLAKSKALIMCVGTALKPLLRAGIRPDFVLALDSSRVTLPQFEGLQDTEGMWLFADMATPPDIIKMFYPRVTFYTGMVNALTDYLYPCDAAKAIYFPCAGSVANIALMFCYYFGCNPIIFAGLDLAIADDGHSHAAGSMHENHLLMPQDDQPFYVTVKGNYQPQVKTPKNFYVYLRWTENFIQKHADRTYINAGAGGAHIEGAILEPLQKILETRLKESEVNANDLLTKIRSCDSAGLRRKVSSRAAKALKELHKLDKYFKEGVKLADEVTQVIQGEKKFKDARQEERFSLQVKKFFEKLGKVDAFKLFDHTVKLDSYLMNFSMKQQRVRQKGCSDAMSQMQGLFCKLMEMLPVFQKCLTAICNARSMKGVAR